MVATRTKRFELGQLVATPGALAALVAAGTSPAALVARHAAGDWGDLTAGDRAANEAALATGDRLLSAYRLGGVKVWVITEGADDAGRRAATTVLLPDEY